MVFAFTASLADTKVHTLDSLLTAAYAAGNQQTSNRFRQIDIQADSTNGGTIAVGDANVSATNYGIKLASSGVQRWGPSEQNNISTLDIYVLASAATQKINVFCMAE